MTLRTLLSALCLAATTLVSPALADKAILVIDGSGSMWGQIDGKNKIVIARETVGALMADWSPDTELGLIAYGHREKANCSDIETLVPVDSGTARDVEAAVGELNPKGKTPITAAVRQAAQELRSTEEKATVILVSDGLETCAADPCAAAAELEAAGVDFTVHVVGFGTTQEENQQLQCLAENTGGVFLGASNASELKTAMAKVKQQVVKPKAKRIEVRKVEAAVGSLQLINNGKTMQYVYDAHGERLMFGHFGKAEQLQPGRYSLQGTKFTTVEDFEVRAGENLVLDMADYVGWFRLANNGKTMQYIYDANGERLMFGYFDKAVQLQPGHYSLRGTETTTVDDFEIKAGQELVIDLGG